MKLNLTRRQQAVYDYLRELEVSNEPPPALEELCDAMGLSSRGSMHKHVQALVEAGLVEPMAGKQRGVRLTPKAMSEPTQLPLLGFISAGSPIEAIERVELVDVPPPLRTDNPCYVLQVRGESMIEDGIFDGDWVVIERCDSARNGQVVVALIDEREATLKRIYQQPGKVVLQPANSAMAAMVYAPERVRVQGVVVGLMRRY